MNTFNMLFEISRCSEGFSTMMTFEISLTFIRVIEYLTDSKKVVENIYGLYGNNFGQIGNYGNNF